MRRPAAVLALSLSMSLPMLAGMFDKKPLEVTPGQAIPTSAITTQFSGKFKTDLPMVVPMVIVSFQTRIRGGMLGANTDEYVLKGVSPEAMQAVTDQVQDMLETELKAAGATFVPFEALAAQEHYRTWVSSPDPMGAEAKRSFFRQGKGGSGGSTTEWERIFTAHGRPLVGNGGIFGGFSSTRHLCLSAQAMKARVVIFRATVNFASIKTNKNAWIGMESIKGHSALEIGFAQMMCFGPDGTPGRIETDREITMGSDFISGLEADTRGITSRGVQADPGRFAKDTVEALRSIVKGFIAEFPK